MVVRLRIDRPRWSAGGHRGDCVRSAQVATVADLVSQAEGEGREAETGSDVPDADELVGAVLDRRRSAATHLE